MSIGERLVYTILLGTILLMTSRSLPVAVIGVAALFALDTGLRRVARRQNRDRR